MNIKKSENKNGNCGQCLNPQTMYQINIKIDLSYDPYNIGDIVCNFRVDVKLYLQGIIRIRFWVKIGYVKGKCVSV